MNLRSEIEKIKNRKKELGWTNQKLSQESGVPVGTLNKIFNGTTRYPRDKTVESVLRALGMAEYSMEDYGTGISLIREAGGYQTARKDYRATVDTYYSLPDEYRAELIDGKFYYIPAPSLGHQNLLMLLTAVFYNYIKKGKKGYKVFAAACDVRLDSDSYTMLKPDIFVAGEKQTKISSICVEGVPEFVVEITSPASSKCDYELKRYKYQNAGVKEYWIVDPVKMRIVVYVFVKDAVPAVYTFADCVRPYLYPDLEIDFGQIRKEMV